MPKAKKSSLSPISLVIKIKNLNHCYKQTRRKKVIALDKINLEIEENEIVALIGPDGVGKSTFLGIISGVKKVKDGGQVFVLGGNIKSSRHRSKISPDIAYMPQGLGSNLYMDLSVYENINYFAKLFKIPKEKAKQRIDLLVHQTDLFKYKERLVRKLSGGMKQKLGLCCALVHDPKILILDEPTTGVDPLSRQNFWNLVWDIKKKAKNMTIIVSTAYMEEVKGFDRIIMMDGGKIIADGSPSELKKKTKSKSLEDSYIYMLPRFKKKEKSKVANNLNFKHIDLSKQPNVIEAKKITKKFGDFVAVNHIDFEIKKGEIFGFVGPNGCGKTTTMKMITGLLPKTDGHHTIFGCEIKAGDMKFRKKIGYMSQSFSLYGELTVYENLSLHVGLFDIPKKIAERKILKSIVKFGLREYLTMKSSKLPLGVKQRLSLAISILHDPEILILDEPTSGVDPIARNNFWETIIKLSRKNAVTIFISTHYLSEANRCDRVAMMNASKLLVCDSPEKIIANKQTNTLEDAFIEYIKEDMNNNISVYK
ncbi:ATP-binding cassette domain-containing protein [Pseudomonadota bacterium]